MRIRVFNVVDQHCTYKRNLEQLSIAVLGYSQGTLHWLDLRTKTDGHESWHGIPFKLESCRLTNLGRSTINTKVDSPSSIRLG